MRMTSNGEVQQIDEHEIKQIAGRAGRFLINNTVLFWQVYRGWICNMHEEIRSQDYSKSSQKCEYSFEE